jgi:hypothetical protein
MQPPRPATLLAAAAEAARLKQARREMEGSISHAMARSTETLARARDLLAKTARLISR